MRVVCVSGLLCVLTMAGCADATRPPPGAAPQPGATQGAAAGVESAGRSSALPATRSTGQSATGHEAKISAKVPASPAPVEQLRKKEAAAPVKQQTAPPLDLASLENRLKETKAIGLLSKIALKNQVDDLLDQFRAYYQGSLKTTLAEMRQRYDLLFLKVLSLLQDGDQSLATAISASREAIWGVLANRQKFATI